MKPTRKPPQPIVNATLPQPRAIFCTITGAQFRENEALRQKLTEAIDEIILVAFAAADSVEEDYVSITSPTDLARDALKNAERVGIARYKKTILGLAQKFEVPSAAEPEYSGRDSFDELAGEI